MKTYNRYIFTLALFLLITTVILAATGEIPLDAYYTAYVVEALAITELYMYFSTRARRGLSFVSTLLFGGFAIILCLQVIKILI